MTGQEQGPCPPTDADVDAARARMAARQVLVDELDALQARGDRAREDATITLVVAIDMECARGLRRKTRFGHDVGPGPPREALRAVDRYLTDWYEAREEQRAAVDAQLAKIEETSGQDADDMRLIGEWLRRGEWPRHH